MVLTRVRGNMINMFSAVLFLRGHIMVLTENCVNRDCLGSADDSYDQTISIP